MTLVETADTHCPRRCLSLRTLVAFSLGVASLLWSAPDADAARFRVRTYSLGRATHTIRSDHNLAAQRVFTQGLALRAYDLLGSKTGSLNAVVDARYATDFALSSSRRDDPLFRDQWNDLALRLAYLDYHPVPAVGLRLGRQWSIGLLGLRDFDGLRATARPQLGPSTRGILGLYGGRDVDLTNAGYNTDDFDVQGLPSRNGEDLDSATLPEDALALLAGGRLGFEWSDQASFEFAYRRRWRTGVRESGETTQLGSERFGAAAAMSPHRRIAVSSSAAYHTLLDSVDRAEFDVAWDIPGFLGTLSTGVEHRRPWFDSSSIFNLFGARPHQGAHAVYQHGVAPFETEIQLRGWGRIYRGSLGPPGFEPTRSDDTTRLGAAAAHFSDIYPWQHPVDWSSQFSYESDTAGDESSHILADTRLRTPLFFDDFYVSGRVLLLGVLAHNPQIESGFATTYVLGADIPIRDIGTFSLVGEHTSGTFYRSTTNLFGTLELEFWR